MKGHVLLRTFPSIQSLPLISLESQSAVKHYVRDIGKEIAQAKITNSGDADTDILSYFGAYLQDMP